jgi:hypothetical protein
MSIATRDSENNKFRISSDGKTTVAVTSEDTGVSLRYDEVSSSVIYLAEGLFGALDSEPKWKIKQVTISGSVGQIKYASNDFNQVWNDRASLTYV